MEATRRPRFDVNQRRTGTHNYHHSSYLRRGASYFRLPCAEMRMHWARSVCTPAGTWWATSGRATAEKARVLLAGAEAKEDLGVDLPFVQPRDPGVRAARGKEFV